MSNSILINKLNIICAHDKIDNDFEIYEFATCEKYIKYGAKIIDDIFISIKANAVVFESGKKFYVLFNRRDNCQENIATALKQEKYNSISVKKISSSQIPDYLLAQLLLNSLNNYKCEGLAFNNITGKLFCLNFDWCKRCRSKNESGGLIKQIISLEIKIDKNNVLNFPLTTFTSIGEKDKLIFKKKKVNEYPMYQLANNATLKRVEFSFNDENFIQKQYQSTKNTLKLIDFSNYQNFIKSKLGVVRKILILANEKLSQYLSINFEEILNFTSVKSDKASHEYKINLIKETLRDIRVNIINKAIGDGAEMFADEVLNSISKNFDCKVKLQEKVSEGFNIIIINNKKYYEKYENLEDVHNVSYGKAIVQHITFEDYNCNIPAVTSCIINELIIKKDCLNKKVTFVDWHNFACSVLLCIKCEDKFAFLCVNKSGNIDYRSMENNMFSENIFQVMINKYTEFEHLVGKDIDCVIKINEGIVGIHKSGEMALPKFLKIAEVLEDVAKKDTIKLLELKNALNNIIISQSSMKIRDEARTILSCLKNLDYTKQEIVALTKDKNLLKLLSNQIYETTGKRVKSYFRSNEIKYDLFGSNLNINWYKKDNEIFYFVGEKNESIKLEFSKASVIRRVFKLNDAEVDIKKISNLMAVDFIRNEQYTVFPFLVKYLHEYVKNQDLALCNTDTFID